MKYKIIISPSKTMDTSAPNDSINENRPKHILKAKEIFGIIRTFDLEKTKEIYSLSDKKAQQIYEMHKGHGQKLYKAIDLYSGTLFKELEIKEEDKEWINDNVLIIDALYGVIKPNEKIAPYRLDFNVKFPIDLKDFWFDIISKELEGHEIINLASKEYSSLINLDMNTPKLDGVGNIKSQRGRKLKELIKNRNN